MKRLLSITVTVLVVFSLCACGGSGSSTGTPEPVTGFRVGYGRESITPSTSVPLAGYGNSLTRMSQGILDVLYATCIAITDGEDNTVLLITLDITSINTELAASVRQGVSDVTDVAADRIILSATHTHSGPDLDSDYDHNMTAYKAFFCEAVAKAAKAAMDDRAVAKLQVGNANTKNLNFVRHYTQEAGTVCGDNYGSIASSPITGHTTQADTEIQLIRFTRDKQKDVLLVNWQAHPKLASTNDTNEGQNTRSLMSADFIGAARSYVEKEADVRFAYFQGAAGNLDTRSSIAGETVTKDVEKFGQRLGDAILHGMKGMKTVQTGGVQTLGQTYTGTVDHTDDDRLDIAREIAELWTSTKDQSACKTMGVPYDIHSSDHANAIIARANMGDTVELELNAISVGDISFVTVPYEMFDTNGVYIKENTPYEMTFILGYANGYNSYIPSAEAFRYGCYEVDIRCMEDGAGEDLASTLVGMLTKLQGE